MTAEIVKYPFKALFDFLESKPKGHTLESRFITRELSEALEALLRNHIELWRMRGRKTDFEQLYPECVKLTAQLLQLMERKELSYVSTNLVMLCLIVGDFNHAVDELTGAATFTVVDGRLTLALNTSHHF